MRDINKNFGFMLVVIYLMTALMTFQLFGVDSLEGKIDAQLYSDSLTYETAAKNESQDIDLISVDGNYMGPVFVLKFLGHSRDLVNIFNVIVLGTFLIVAVKRLYINRILFLSLVACSPLIFFSTYGVNKEIFIPLCVLSLTIYVDNRNIRWLILAGILALLVRWQLCVFLLLAAGLTSRYWPLRHKRFVTLVILTFGISLVYPILADGFFNSIENVSIEGAVEESGTAATGLYPIMQDLQRHYGYFLVVIPKSVQLLVGFLSRINLQSPSIDFWNNFVIMGHCLLNLVLLLCISIRRNFSLSNNIVFLICMYCVFFAVTPVFAPRYFLPVTIWMIMLVSERTENVIRSLPNATT